ncbi:MAG: replicative DNA helicase [Bacteroidota bacterium]
MEKTGKFKKNLKATPAEKTAVTANVASNLGKLPPQALDLEEAVLGALMLEKNAVAEVIDILKPECFYKEANQHIFESIFQLFHHLQPVDILTVRNDLQRKGELENVGGDAYIFSLTNRVGSAANIEFHARIILQKYIQRELIRISSETIRDAFDDSIDVFNLLDGAERNLFNVAEGNIKRKVSDMPQLVQQVIENIEKAAKQEEGVTGVRSGFTDLDRITSGWQKSDLIIVAARPGMGKTAFVMSLARNAAVEFKHGVAFFSLEMSSVQLVNRLISSETEIPSDKLRKGQLDAHEWEQLNSKIRKLEDAPIFIDDTPALSIFELRTKCRRLKHQKNIDLIIVDYLQLMTTGENSRGGNREQEISSISRALKGIAKELDVPIIALSQLSRNVESRGGNKRPQLSDLRESGAIEQDADMVMFIYRPEYYNITQDEDGNSTLGTAELIISKHRNGALSDVHLRFIDRLAKFDNLVSHDFIEEAFDTIQPNQNVDRPKSKIRGSKMNDMPDIHEDDTPF